MSATESLAMQGRRRSCVRRLDLQDSSRAGREGMEPIRAPQLRGEEVARLVELARLGDRSAWNALVNEFSAMVWTIARSHHLSHADACYVAQASWLSLLDRLDEINEPARVVAWLATTARREFLVPPTERSGAAAPAVGGAALGL